VKLELFAAFYKLLLLLIKSLHQVSAGCETCKGKGAIECPGCKVPTHDSCCHCFRFLQQHELIN
jgi:hypothetical protein